MPAVNIAKQVGLTKALSLLVIYDTCIHSGPGGVTMIRNLFPAASPANGGDEKAWVQSYVNARRNWLATHKLTVLHACVYRMDAVNDLIKADNWDLVLPFTCRGRKVS
jgi:chitosanase